MLRTFLHCRFVGIQRCRWRGYSFRLLNIRSTFFGHIYRCRCGSPVRFVYKRFFFHRRIHLAGFLQTIIQSLPIHFRPGITATTTIRGSGRSLERVEVWIIMHLRRLYRTSLIECGNIRHTFRIEINGRHSIEFTQWLFYRCGNDLPNCLLVFKLNLGLGRMYIHINVGRVHIKVNEIRNLFACRNQLFISIHHRFMEIRMTHITPVHKEILMSTFLTRRLWFGNKAGDLHHSSIHIYRQQMLVQLLAKYGKNALAKRHRRQVE